VINFNAVNGIQQHSHQQQHQQQTQYVLQEQQNTQAAQNWVSGTSNGSGQNSNGQIFLNINNRIVPVQTLSLKTPASGSPTSNGIVNMQNIQQQQQPHQMNTINSLQQQQRIQILSN